MKPYCPNNSNFTFREICCSPPHYNDYCNCGCGQPQHNCCCKTPNNNCCCNPKPSCPPKDKPKEKPPYICLPIKKGNTNMCNPFLYVMIGYMIGNNYSFENNSEQEDLF